jgi:hypothetical protein
MLEKLRKYFLPWPILLALCLAPAIVHAEVGTAPYDPCVGAGLDCGPTIKPIVKVKPGPVTVPPAVTGSPLKVKSNALSGDAISGYNPVNWWSDCCLPVPTKGQFWMGPKITWARIDGEARRGLDLGTNVQSSIVDFDDHLGLSRSGHMRWSIEAMYQLRPRWGIRYSFTPLSVSATTFPKSAFSFAGQTFASGTQIQSRWDRAEHRAGLVFNINRTTGSQTNLFADWLNVSDRLSVSSAGLTAPAKWDDTKNLAMLGLEFDKCLRNYQGNTLAISGKGGIAFLSDTIGYEAEAALSYLIPIRTGRFGFVKGGYHYASFKKDKGNEMLRTTVDGPFLQMGFLF